MVVAASVASWRRLALVGVLVGAGQPFFARLSLPEPEPEPSSVVGSVAAVFIHWSAS